MKSQVVKIVSGWSDTGGSTVAFIRLCNQLNSAGFDCTFYGPHDWHLGKCQAAKLDFSDFMVKQSDIVLAHCVHFNQPLPVKRKFLVLHEKKLFPVKDKYKSYDKVIFLHEPHRQWHGTPKEHSVIIPNFFEALERKLPHQSRGNIAGIIGNIIRRKNTHLSIQKALDDKRDKVYIYGNVIKQDYFNEKVKPYIDKYPDRVIFKGFCEDKQAMYDSIDCVYHYSNEEIACFVLGECKLQGIPCYFGDNIDDYDIFPNEFILEKWKKLLNGK